MIGIASKRSLARLLGLDLAELLFLAENTDRFVKRFWLIDPGDLGRRREVLSVTGKLRLCQIRLLRRLFQKCFSPVPWSHGGVRGRNIKTNAASHLSSSWLFTTDISHFYPSIHNSRLYRLLARDHQCSPDVARIITRLCTHDHVLALGLITSPILADQLLLRPDRRLAGVANQLGLTYTRFVDDIAFSGNFPFDGSGIPRLVESVLGAHGFKVRRSKHKMGLATDIEMTVTQLRLKQGKLDVRREYLDQLVESMKRLHQLGLGERFHGQFMTRSQLEGKVRYVCWVNGAHKRRLLSMMKNLKWQSIEQHAEAQGLMAPRKSLLRAD